MRLFICLALLAAAAAAAPTQWIKHLPNGPHGRSEFDTYRVVGSVATDPSMYIVELANGAHCDDCIPVEERWHAMRVVHPNEHMEYLKDEVPQRKVMEFRNERPTARVAHTDPDEGEQAWARNMMALDGAHDGGFVGENVLISYSDSGRYLHEDLDAHAARDIDYSVASNTNDPTPIIADSFDHGTSVASIGSGAREGTCGAGVAPNSRFFSVQMPLNRAMSSVDEYTGFTSGMFRGEGQINASILSCSWGPTDYPQLSRITVLGEYGLDRVALQGRNGLGAIIVFAAGNGKRNRDRTVYDRYASYEWAIAVGSIQQDGLPAYYSEPGTSVRIAMPAGTPDVGAVAAWGRSDSRSMCIDRDHQVPVPPYYMMFSGTSAAAPMASGLVALMLSANPLLTMPDVIDILVTAANANRGVVARSEPWMTNRARAEAGGPFYWHQQLGAGVPNATMAVLMARDRQAHLRAHNFTVVFERPNVVVDGAGSWGYNTVVSNVPAGFRLFTVTATFGFTSGPYCALAMQRDLAVRSPANTLSVFLPENPIWQASVEPFPFATHQFHGEDVAGTWSIEGENRCHTQVSISGPMSLTFFGGVPA